MPQCRCLRLPKSSRSCSATHSILQSARFLPTPIGARISIDRCTGSSRACCPRCNIRIAQLRQSRSYQDPAIRRQSPKRCHTIIPTLSDCLQSSQPARKLSSTPLTTSIESGPTKRLRSRRSLALGKTSPSSASSPIARGRWGRCPSVRFQSGVKSMKTGR